MKPGSGRTYTPGWCAAPGAVGLADAGGRTDQDVGGATGVQDLGFEDETLTLSSGLSRDTGVTAELGCKETNGSNHDV